MLEEIRQAPSLGANELQCGDIRWFTVSIASREAPSQINEHETVKLFSRDWCSCHTRLGTTHVQNALMFASIVVQNDDISAHFMARLLRFTTS